MTLFYSLYSRAFDLCTTPFHSLQIEMHTLKLICILKHVISAGRYGSGVECRKGEVLLFLFVFTLSARGVSFPLRLPSAWSSFFSREREQPFQQKRKDPLL